MFLFVSPASSAVIDDVTFYPAVPEPGTLLLLAAGFVFLGTRARGRFG